jgi:hypothetical protein
MPDKRTLGVMAAIVLLLVTAGAAFFVVKSYLVSGEAADSAAVVTPAAPDSPSSGAIPATQPANWVMPDFSKMTPRFTSADFGHDAVIMNNPRGMIAISAGVYSVDSTPGTFWYWERPWPNVNSNFACEVVGRIASGHGTWSLYVSNLDVPHQGIRIALHSEGTLEIGRSVVADPKVSEIHVGPFAHSAIKSGAEFDRLLAVLRGQELRVFVNGVSVCEPVHLRQHLLPAKLALSGSAEPDGPSRVEFTSCKVWWVKN